MCVCVFFSVGAGVGMMNHPPIPVTELAEHTELLKANDNLKLSQEYEVRPLLFHTICTKYLDFNFYSNISVTLVILQIANFLSRVAALHTGAPSPAFAATSPLLIDMMLKMVSFFNVSGNVRLFVVFVKKALD